MCAGPDGKTFVAAFGSLYRLRRLATLEIVAKESVEFRVRHRSGQAVELALFGDFARRADEGSPSHARERATDADAANPHRRDVIQTKAARP
jgi:hypothetical protein